MRKQRSPLRALAKQKSGGMTASGSADGGEPRFWEVFAGELARCSQDRTDRRGKTMLDKSKRDHQAGLRHEMKRRRNAQRHQGTILAAIRQRRLARTARHVIRALRGPLPLVEPWTNAQSRAWPSQSAPSAPVQGRRWPTRPRNILRWLALSSLQHTTVGSFLNMHLIAYLSQDADRFTLRPDLVSRAAKGTRCPFMALLYGPAARCKPKVMIWKVGLVHLYPAYAWSLRAPGHHGYPRAFDLIRVSAPKARRAPLQLRSRPRSGKARQEWFRRFQDARSQ